MQRAAPPFWLFCSASVGALLGLAFVPHVAPLVVLLAMGVLAVVATRGLVQAVALLALAATLSCLSASLARTAQERRQEQLPRGSAVFEGIVDDVGGTRAGNARAVILVSGALVDGHRPEPMSARISAVLPPGSDAVSPGDRVRVRGVVRLPARPDQPGELDEAALALSRGIDARLAVRTPMGLAVMQRGVEFRASARVRAWLSRRVQALATPREAGLILALLVGDTSLFEEEQLTAYREVGAGHLLAVSGLQVSLLALIARTLLVGLFALLGGRAGSAVFAGSMGALVAVWAFVFVCGAPASAVRAGAMATAVLFAGLIGRRARAIDALGLAGLVCVLVSPESVVDPSFLLSYGAVLGLALAPRPASAHSGAVVAVGFGGQMRRLWHRLSGPVCAALAAGAVTLPISAFLFGQVSLSGLVANVILVPVASALQVPAIAFGVIGALLGSGALIYFGGQAALLIEALVTGLAEAIGSVSFVEAPSPPLTIALVVAVALLVMWAGRRRLVPTALAATTIAAFLLVWAHPERGHRFTVVPIGQGDATIVQTDDGKTILIDGGGVLVGRDPGEAVLVPTLKRLGVTRIDVMVLSHAHPDHGNGLVAVARAFDVGELWHSGGPADHPVLAPLLAALPSTTVVKSTPALLSERAIGTAMVQVLAPAPAEGSARYPELGENDNSLVLRLCWHGGPCALWTGDVEALGEGLLLEDPDRRLLLRADLVKAGHHGSSTSSTPAFVAATGAKDVIFCTGRDNTFGFPHATVVDRWRAAGARLWDTAVHGQLRAVLRADGVKVGAFRPGVVQAPTAE
jgi:competence protein ComEC